MSFIDTDGRPSRFLTRAQKCAITIESAPRSSKKWLSAATRSTPAMSASTSARIVSVPVVGSSCATLDTRSPGAQARPEGAVELHRYRHVGEVQPPPGQREPRLVDRLLGAEQDTVPVQVGAGVPPRPPPPPLLVAQDQVER